VFVKFYKVSSQLHAKQELQWIDKQSKYNLLTNFNSYSPLQSLGFIEDEAH